jgi:superfamily II DNA helicase RecQ
MKNMAAIIVDEGHCVSQWGEHFRKRFSELGKLRSYVPCSVPFLVTSATLPPHVLEQVQSQLHFYEDSTFLVNLGNDRPNVSMILCQMQGAARDLQALDFVLDDTFAGNPLKHTIIFFNSQDLCQRGYKYLRSQLPEHQCDKIGFILALRTGDVKHETMARFPAGEIDILCATEAAGMVRVIFILPEQLL